MTKEINENKRSSRPFIVVLTLLALVLGVMALLNFRKSAALKDKLISCEDDLTKYDSLLRERNIELAAWKDAAGKEQVQPQTVKKPLYTQEDGVFFEVQIGSFKDFDLDEYLNEMVEIRQEKDAVSTKLLLGRFRSVKQARLFENDMKRIGLKDAFVIGRVDNKLMDVDDAIEVLKRQNKD